MHMSVTNETKYLNSARKLLDSFFVEVKDGGVTYKTPDNGCGTRNMLMRDALSLRY